MMGRDGGGDRSAAGSPGVEVALILLALGGAAGYAVRSPVYALYKRLTAPRANRRSVAGAREGELCAIEGTVHRTEEELKTSPCGTPCVAYAVEVELLVTEGRSTAWVSHVEEERGVDFLLEDGSGKARVLGAKASITRAG